MSIKRNYTQKELFMNGAQTYKNFLIEIINKNINDSNNFEIINNDGKIIFYIDFEKKIKCRN